MYKHSNCEKDAIVHQLLEVNAKITVTPLLNHGDPTISCIKTDVRAGYDYQEEKCGKWEKCSENCTFYVTQLMCVEIPITFGVEVDVDTGKIMCGDPDFGPCTCRCENHTTDDDDFCRHDNNTIDEVYEFCRQDNHTTDEVDNFVDISIIP